MEITVRARNCDVPTRLKDLARQKVEHATRFFDRVMDLEVRFSEETNPRIATPAAVEITARVKGTAIRALGAGEDHHEAIDTAVAKFERQLRRYKTRLVDRGRRAGSDARAGSVATGEMRAMGSRAAADVEASPSIVRRKSFELRPMSADDAVLQLELLGHDFFLFLDNDTGHSSVVYRRGDGDIGLIEGVPSDVAVGAGTGA